MLGAAIRPDAELTSKVLSVSRTQLAALDRRLGEIKCRGGFLGLLR